MDEFNGSSDVPEPTVPSYPAVQVPSRPYPAPGLTLVPGPVRTYALIVTGIPLLLIVILALAIQSSSSGGSTSGTSYNGSSGNLLGGSGYGGGQASAGSPDPAVTDTSAGVGGFGDGGTDPTASDGSDADGSGQLPFTPDSPSPTPSASATSGPASVVTSYYNALDTGDYQTAWNLGGKNLDSSYAHFVSGYSGTEQVTVTVLWAQGDTVSVDIDSEQSDGTDSTFSGTYTVAGGAITSADIQQTS